MKSNQTIWYDPKEDDSGIKVARQNANLQTARLFGQAERKKFNSKLIKAVVHTSHLGGQHMALDRMQELYAEDPEMTIEELIGFMQQHVTLVNNEFHKCGGYRVSDRYSLERVMNEQGKRKGKDYS